MIGKDFTAERLEEIDRPFKIVSERALDHVVCNAPDDICTLLIYQLQAMINFTTFTAVPLERIKKGRRFSQKRILAGLRWIEEAGLIERAEAGGETLWRFTEAFGYEGTPEKWREIKQRQDAH